MRLSLIRSVVRRIRVGLTGGIASGKSLVSGYFEELGAVLIDYDALARQVVEPGSKALAAIVKEFGPEILDSTGNLDRLKLGELVFSDQGALIRLNAITHPAIRKAAKSIERCAPVGSMVIHEIPLLIETDEPEDFDAIIVVDVPESTQLSRLQTRNGFTTEQALARIARQATRSERLSHADFVIDNSGSPEETKQQVEAIWQELQQHLRLKSASCR